jgi:hypothetical protein
MKEDQSETGVNNEEDILNLECSKEINNKEIKSNFPKFSKKINQNLSIQLQI